MSETFLTWHELAAAHRKLKADHEELRKLVDQMADAIENHVHGIEQLYATRTTRPLKRTLPIPQPTPGPISGRIPEPAAPAEGAR